MQERDKQKEIIIEKWDDLIQEISKHLEMGKKSGGTLSHKIGSVKERQIELLEFYKKYT